MLKDLFFSVCCDEFGLSWQAFIIFLVSLTLAALIFTIARTKVLNKKFTNKHYIFFVLSLIIFYQVIPVWSHFLAFVTNIEDFQRAVKYEEFAIKSSIIPYQRGLYYNNLAIIYQNKKPKKSVEACDKAYEYIGYYDYSPFNRASFSYESIGEYDKAIESARQTKLLSKGTYIATIYIYKGELQNALSEINNQIDMVNKDIKSLEENEQNLEKIQKLKQNLSQELALKAYLIKKLGDKVEAEKVYEEALNLDKRLWVSKNYYDLKWKESESLIRMYNFDESVEKQRKRVEDNLKK